MNDSTFAFKFIRNKSRTVVSNGELVEMKVYIDYVNILIILILVIETIFSGTNCLKNCRH